MIQKYLPLVVVLGLAALWLGTRLAQDRWGSTEQPLTDAHGGQVISLGAGRYHVEAVFGKDGTLAIYTLGRDASRVIDVERQTLTAYVKFKDELYAHAVTLEPDPQPGDISGRASRFSGAMPSGLTGQLASVTVPNMRLNGERFHLTFTSLGDEHDLVMPAGVSGEEEKQLYLVPGGKYTEEDIAANKGLTASQKYPNFRARHDPNPKKGALLCPVTFTKANPECTWTINGKVYQFCCPPCIDELVRMAKEEPELLKDPEEYVKR